MSTALKVKKALVNAIGQHPTFRNRLVSLGHPGSDAELEMVFVTGIRSNESSRMLGKAHRREELTVELGVVAETLGNDLEDTHERAYLMLQGVQEAIYEDSSLGGIVHLAEVVTWDERSFNGPERTVVEISIEVRVLADFDGTES